MDKNIRWPVIMFCWSWSSYDSYSWYYDLTYARENQSACIRKSGKISNISWYSLYFFLHCAIFFLESGSWNARMEKSNDYSTSLSKLACCSCLTNTALSCIPANVASLLILLLPPHYFVLPTTSVHNYCISVSIYMQNNHWITTFLSFRNRICAIN